MSKDWRAYAAHILDGVDPETVDRIMREHIRPLKDVVRSMLDGGA